LGVVFYYNGHWVSTANGTFKQCRGKNIRRIEAQDKQLCQGNKGYNGRRRVYFRSNSSDIGVDNICAIFVVKRKIVIRNP